MELFLVLLLKSLIIIFIFINYIYYLFPKFITLNNIFLFFKYLFLTYNILLIYFIMFIYIYFVNTTSNVLELEQPAVAVDIIIGYNELPIVFDYLKNKVLIVDGSLYNVSDNYKFFSVQSSDSDIITYYKNFEYINDSIISKFNITYMYLYAIACLIYIYYKIL